MANVAMQIWFRSASSAAFMRMMGRLMPLLRKLCCKLASGE